MTPTRKASRSDLPLSGGGKAKRTTSPMKIPLALFMLAISGIPAVAAHAQPQLHCATGPVTRVYGGTKWLVHGCTDGKSLVFTAMPGTPAAPFEFDLTYTGQG